MRILKVTETYAPFAEYGGPPVKVLALAEGLAQRGHEVTVLTADWGIAERNESASVVHSPYGLRRVQDGVEAFYLATRLRYRTVTWNPGVRRFCRERLGKADVVHIYGLYDLLGPAVASACRRARVPYVVEPIGMYVPIVRNVWLKRVYHALLGGRMIQGAQAVIATSGLEGTELAKYGVAGDQIVRRRNGIARPANFPPRGAFRARLNLPSEARLILFLGRIVPKKSPVLLLNALAILNDGDQERKTRLVYVGPDDGGLLHELKDRAQQLGISERVYFTGPLFGADKWSAYRDADVFVLPSQNENFGNSAAEAAVAGTPVIVTETCGVAELLRNGAALIVQHDEAALAEALRRVLCDERLRAEMRSAQASLTPQLSWEEPITEMEHLYERLVVRRKNGC